MCRRVFESGRNEGGKNETKREAENQLTPYETASRSGTHRLSSIIQTEEQDLCVLFEWKGKGGWCERATWKGDGTSWVIDKVSVCG